MGSWYRVNAAQGWSPLLRAPQNPFAKHALPPGWVNKYPIPNITEEWAAQRHLHADINAPRPAAVAPFSTICYTLTANPTDEKADPALNANGPVCLNYYHAPGLYYAILSFQDGLYLYPGVTS